MAEYFDIACRDDMDPFARDVGPVEALAQDIDHWLDTDPQTLLLDPEWGLGISSYLSKPLPQTFAADLENKLKSDFDDRVSDCRCTVIPMNVPQGHYRMNLQIEADSGFLERAYLLTPQGVTRL